MMGHATIPVDLFNPGQVFGCLGLVEAADVLLGGASGGFDWTQGQVVRFHLHAGGTSHPVKEVLRFLAEAEVHAEAPFGSEHRTEKWSVPAHELRPDAPFPFAEPESPATLPAVLVRSGDRLRIDHWGDGTRDNVKFWAGAGGYPGVALLRDALKLVVGRWADVVENPFGLSAPQDSSFRFDWRRDYIALQTGFSLNNHNAMSPLGYPLVEVLAAIGLQNARPQRPDRRNKLAYRYGVLGMTDAPPCLLRAALGAPALPFPMRSFRIALDWPGKENQARCITDVVEEN